MEQDKKLSNSIDDYLHNKRMKRTQLGTEQMEIRIHLLSLQVYIWKAHDLGQVPMP